MTARPWYAFYVPDYRAKTARLSMAQHGAYRLLIDEYYSTREPLPMDVEYVFKICCAYVEAEKRDVLFVLRRYFIEGDDGWHHTRIDTEIVKTEDIKEKRSLAGKSSAAKRQHKTNKSPTHSQQNAGILQPQSEEQVLPPINPPTPVKRKKQANPLELPAWVPFEAWESFVQMRRTLRAPLTDNGARLAIAELDKLRDEGHDPTKVLEQSVLNSWRGLFPIGAKNERGNRASREGRGIRDGAEHALAAIRRGEGENRGEPSPATGNAAGGPPTPGVGTNSNAGTDHPPTDRPRRDLPKLSHDDGGEEFEVSHVLRGPSPSHGTAIAAGLQAVSDQSGEQIFSDAGTIACARMKGNA